MEAVTRQDGLGPEPTVHDLVTGTDDDYCGSDPPLRADDPDTQWGDCWCTRASDHGGDCVCEPCRDRYGAPGWPKPQAGGDECA